MAKSVNREKPQAGEIRQDIASGQWVVIATERSKRPHDFIGEKSNLKKPVKYKDDCPFCNLAKFPQEPDLLRLPDDPDHWQVHIFENLYPAFRPGPEIKAWEEGPYKVMEAMGYHEILATRFHNEDEIFMTNNQVSLQLEALVLRYRQLKSEPFINYIQIIKNYGKAGGASLEHPHNQIIGLPVLPVDILDLLNGAEAYAKRTEDNPFQVMLDFELQSKRRMIFENDQFVAFCPYASKVPFEVRIMPKVHDPYFENLDIKGRDALAEILRVVLAKLYVGLKDPAYNYYIQSAPCDDTGMMCDTELFKNFRWYIDVMPRMTNWGGLELGSGMIINSTMPESAAEFLREVNIGEVVKS